MEAIWPLDLFVNVEIQIWALDQHGRDLGRQITLEREGRFFAKNRQKIGDISPINRRHMGFLGNLLIRLSIYPVSPIYRQYIADFLAIFGEKSPGQLISSICRFAPRRHAIYKRYFADFFRFFPPWLGLPFHLYMGDHKPALFIHW